MGSTSGKNDSTARGADIGMIGLAVMGSNLALNMNGKGFDVAVYNHRPDRTRDFMSGPAKGKAGITAFYTLEEFVGALKKPRKVFLMIRAGSPVDEMMGALIPLLEPGDIIIDGGNSYFGDTARRAAEAESHGLRYIGTGVSGGEEGALHGPCLMPGGSPSAWPEVKDIFTKIAADHEGQPCCCWIGGGGAGHFVKMVHNGIEYGDMQLICEAYHMMRDGLGMTCDEMSEVFAEWNRGPLSSYLIGITADILAYRDGSGERTLEHILDRAGQKGTGKWTGISALEEGVPLTLITEAVLARCLSSQREERLAAAEVYRGEREIKSPAEDRKTFVGMLNKALYASRIVSYAQGFSLMRTAAGEYGWDLNFGDIALIWRGGCIIRSSFLGEISDAFGRRPDLPNLLVDGYFAGIIKDSLPAWRGVVAAAAESGIPVPAFSSALNYFYGYTCGSLPSNLLQAQRDYFGAHTYERTDAPAGVFFHTDWTGQGGPAASTQYTV